MDDVASLSDKVLTISVAAYNVEKTIEETLDSLVVGVPDEILHKIEIIVVNDGSQDGTSDAVKKYAERYPESVRIYDKENAGWGSTVNTSIKLARGKYLKLLDGDDWFLTENIPEFVHFLEGAEADLVMSPYIKRYPDEELQENNHRLIGKEFSRIERLDPEEDIFMHELAVRTDRLRSGGVKIAEKCFYTDNEFAFEAIRCSDTVQRYEKPVYVYRLGNAEQSVGLNGIKKHYHDTVVVAERIYDSFQKYEMESRCSDVKVDLLKRKILLITDALYVSYLLMDSWETKKELMEFDCKIKGRYGRVYELTNATKKIKLLRLSGFMLYGFMARKVKQRYGG
ncbi:hypothetical protein BXO88_01265 [Oribacterium sp. C9]|uniref:glycosyltransferase family 2 protein n=1 Tax=Oribacterium sp. C9 TaxID=1943579 RepID=UPI0009900444|nr:glycosyltransferase family 2 protein [Oribacterium sp. C9]OON88449.1 hypothetical protein BXO88_01265 [Oribacterium sp. C9]